MFKLNRNLVVKSSPQCTLLSPVAPALFERLEDRRMLSASLHHHVKHAHMHTSATTVSSKHISKASATTTTTTTDSDGDSDSSSANTTTYSALQTSNAAAATELQTLAGTTAIDPTQVVRVRVISSTKTYYSIVLTPSTGVRQVLTSDQAGNPVTPPTSSSTTLADTSIPSAAVSEITNLATALGATTPVAATTPVRVRTADGLTTYSVSLAPSTASTTGESHNIRITVDAAGNPAGNMKIPFSALSGTLMSSGLTTLAGTTTIPATQNVFVRTAGGVTTYTVYLASTGQSLQLTVDTTGAAATPASGGEGFGHGWFFGGGFGGGGNFGGGCHG